MNDSTKNDFWFELSVQQLDTSTTAAHSHYPCRFQLTVNPRREPQAQADKSEILLWTASSRVFKPSFQQLSFFYNDFMSWFRILCFQLDSWGNWKVYWSWTVHKIGHTHTHFFIKWTCFRYIVHRYREFYGDFTILAYTFGFQACLWTLALLLFDSLVAPSYRFRKRQQSRRSSVERNKKRYIQKLATQSQRLKKKPVSWKTKLRQNITKFWPVENHFIFVETHTTKSIKQ